MNRYKSILLVLLSFVLYLIGFAQPHRYPIDKAAIINGEKYMFSSTPLNFPSEIPLEPREFADYAMLHRVGVLPPYYTALNGFVANPNAEKLDSIVIAGENGGGGKVVFCYDSLGILTHQMIKEGPNVYAEIFITRDAKKQETKREIKFANGDKMVYELTNGRPTQYELVEGGRTSEKVSWTYKNSMIFSAVSNTVAEGKATASYTHTPMRKLESIKIKSGKETTTTQYEFSDYEASVYNPIVYSLNEKRSKGKPYNIYSYRCIDNGDTYLRVNKVAERTIYKLKGTERIPVLPAVISFKSYANGAQGGAKNMVDNILVKTEKGEVQLDEAYSYYPDLKLQAVASSRFGEIQYIYNKDKNVKLIIISKDDEKKTLHFYYTNFEEERIRFEAEKVAKEAEEAARIAREAEEQAQSEADQKASEVEDAPAASGESNEGGIKDESAAE